MPAEARRDWTRAQRRLHWWTACLVVIAFPLGWIMVGISLDQLFLKFALYQLHKTIGILVFVLVLARLAIRSRRGRPAWDATLFAWQRRAAETMHASLYQAAEKPLAATRSYRILSVIGSIGEEMAGCAGRINGTTPFSAMSGLTAGFLRTIRCAPSAGSPTGR